ncbi:MAG: nitroreductase/quinone reductase family protein [Chloroflexota bacterium]
MILRRRREASPSEPVSSPSAKNHRRSKAAVEPASPTTANGQSHRPWWKHPIVLWLGIPLVVLRAGVEIAFRRKWPPAVNAVKSFNHNVLNPQMLRMAGKPGWYAARVEHIGRRTGQAHATPVVAEIDGDEMLIPLPYGTNADWCQNILAAGHADVVDHGNRYRVTQPEIISYEQVAERLSPSLRRTGKTYTIDYFLRLHAAPAVQP